MTAFHLRALLPSDQDILWDIFHVALWDPPPAPLRPREVMQHPEVRIYAEDWGRREGDVGVLMEVDGEAAGACWMRLVMGGKGLSYIDDATPQLRHCAVPEVPALRPGRAADARGPRRRV